MSTLHIHECKLSAGTLEKMAKKKEKKEGKIEGKRALCWLAATTEWTWIILLLQKKFEAWNCDRSQVYSCNLLLVFQTKSDREAIGTDQLGAQPIINYTGKSITMKIRLKMCNQRLIPKFLNCQEVENNNQWEQTGSSREVIYRRGTSSVLHNIKNSSGISFQQLLWCDLTRGTLVEKQNIVSARFMKFKHKLNNKERI